MTEKLIHTVKGEITFSLIKVPAVALCNSLMSFSQLL